MSRRVRFNEGTDFTKEHPKRQFPTPHPKTKKDSSSSDEEVVQVVVPLPAPKRRVRRGKKKRSGGSSSDSYRRRGHIANTRKDRRRSSKERKRRSDLAKGMPRALDGKFVSKYDTTTPRLPSTSEYSGTPIRGYSSAPEFAVALGSPAPTSDDERPQRSRSPFSSTPQKQQSDKEASFLNTTLPKMPSGKFIKQIFQTPEFEKKTPQSDKEESFLNTTYPELPSGKFVKQIFQTPGFQRILAAAIAEVVQKTPGTKIDFGTDSDSEEPSQEPPRRRRRSSRS